MPGKLVDSLGDQVLGVRHATKELGDLLSFDREKFRLAAALASTGETNFGVMRLNETQLEAFLGFSRREFVNPSEAAEDSTWSSATASGGAPTRRSSGCGSSPSSSPDCRTTRC